MFTKFERTNKIAVITLITVATLNYQVFTYQRKFLMPAELYTYFPAIIHQKSFPPTRSIKKLTPGIEHSASALRLPSTGQLFCFVETSERYYDERISSIASTWLPKCDNGRFFSKTPLPDSNMTYSTVYRNLKDTYYDLFRKTTFGFYYSYMHISQSFDWYLKADDDTYFAIDHLKEYLSTLDPAKPLYLGYVLKPYFKNGFNSGGAGYILSKAAVQLFVEKLYHDEYKCPYDWAEDRGMGRCLSRVGIYPTDTRDEKGLNRFMPYTPRELAVTDQKWHFYPIGTGPYLSEKFVSLHRFPPLMMKSLDESLNSTLDKRVHNSTIIKFDNLLY